MQYFTHIRVHFHYFLRCSFDPRGEIIIIIYFSPNSLARWGRWSSILMSLRLSCGNFSLTSQTIDWLFAQHSLLLLCLRQLPFVIVRLWLLANTLFPIKLYNEIIEHRILLTYGSIVCPARNPSRKCHLYCVQKRCPGTWRDIPFHLIVICRTNLIMSSFEWSFFTLR